MCITKLKTDKDKGHRAQQERDRRDHQEHREGEALGNTREMTAGMTQDHDRVSLTISLQSVFASTCFCKFD